MLILAPQRLVILEVPKTASKALRKMLRPHSAPLLPKVPRHIGYIGFTRHHRKALEQSLGGAVETLAVVREPLRRMQSWYRYRLRDGVARTRISTRDVSFEQFMLAYLSDDPPVYANIGRQDRFIGWGGKAGRVDHLFDYNRLDLMTEFLGERIGQDLELPRANVSPEAEEMDFSLTEPTMARFLERNEAEFEMYRQVRRAGYLGVQKAS